MMDVYLSTITTNVDNSDAEWLLLIAKAIAVEDLVLTTHTYEDVKELTESGAALYEEIAR